MSVDRYTKFVLTAIAIALVWIAVQLTTVPHAHTTAQSSARQLQDVNIASIAGVPAGRRIFMGTTGTNAALAVVSVTER